MTEAVLLAALTAYSKTLDLIMSVRADMSEADRRKEWEKHFARLEAWDKFIQKLFTGATP